MNFKLAADYQPTGDQPQAIERLVASIAAGNKHQTLLGVTGSGKTFTMANVIARCQRPTLIISHNKTLAAQLYSEFKNFFPENAVEYFVSYYDYYQPEAYIPSSDTFIEKDSSINEEIERLRMAATSSLVSRRDVIVVASVSCIYGLGSPQEFTAMMIPLRRGAPFGRNRLLERLVENIYERNDYELKPGRFRVRGDTVDVMPSYLEHGPAGGIFRRRRGEFERVRSAHRRGHPRRSTSSIFIRRTNTSPPAASSSRRSRRSARNLTNGWRGLRRTASTSRPSASGCGPTTILRCCRRWGSAAASRTTRGT
jgi:hypothetical protein